MYTASLVHIIVSNKAAFPQPDMQLHKRHVSSRRTTGEYTVRGNFSMFPRHTSLDSHRHNNALDAEGLEILLSFQT